MSQQSTAPGNGPNANSGKPGANPYVGLRPFEVDESLLFFGRSEQILDLVQLLHEHHFVAVVGSSGCGKSSLLRAGVIPALKAGYLIQESDKWSITIMRPGQSPMRNLVEAVLSTGTEGADPAAVSALLDEIESKGISPIVDFLLEKRGGEDLNFFLLVDQFEELFRFAISKRGHTYDEALEFVNVILELANQERLPVYVMITMRSDFIGDCTRFHGLPEAMNESLFLVPKLHRMQMKMAIEGPARLYGGKLNPALVSRLLNELSDLEDQLPLLQHALMRIWDHELLKDQSGTLDMADFEFIGGLENALSQHADEALQQLSEQEIELAKEIFQALTTVDEKGRKTRRPVLLSELQASTGAKKEQLLKIIDRFIADKRCFLIVNNAADSNDKLIDISHESLIRKWEKLDAWMDEEAESASHYLRLAAYTQDHSDGKKDFLSGVELDILLAWHQKFKPLPSWAHRYRDGFDESIAYLAQSKNEQIRRQELEARARKRQRALWIGLIGLFVLAAITTMSTFLYKNWSEQNQELARNMERFARERDSLAQIAINEKEAAVAQLKILEDAQDSVQNIISQISDTDQVTKNKLSEVSEQLGTAIQTSEKDIRRKELQLKISKEAGNPRIIAETLRSVSIDRKPVLSPEELVNALYFLNRTEKSAWNTGMVEEARAIMDRLEQAAIAKTRSIGPQAMDEIRQFQKYLSEREYDLRSQYTKKAG
jgi:energy-coupling factor transporter ATP-binding protein EcfA2